MSDKIIGGSIMQGDNNLNEGYNKEPDKRPGKLRNIKYYILNALKFYELKNESLTPVIFIIILFTSFSGVLISDKLAKSTFLNVIYTFVSIIILYSASTIYLFAYLTELKKKDCSFRFCLTQIFKKIVKILIAHIAFISIIFTGLFLFIIPGLVFYHMFMFNTCYLLDKNIGIVEAFNSSKNLTTGRKMDVFATLVMFNLVLFLPVTIIVFVTSSTPNSLIFNFVISFITTIITIMQQRLIAMMYMDMEHGIN
jgi:hypothetical protein